MSDQCEHENFKANVSVGRILNQDNKAYAFTADITVECADCGMPFCFLGLPTGLSATEPCVEFGGKEARMPITPQDTMMIGTFPGYKITVENKQGEKLS